VHTVREVAENEQYQARDFFQEHDHPSATKVRTPGAPCRFGRTPWRIKRPAPRLGEHNRKIFGQRLGLDEIELKQLAAEHIV
jgi:formyl-CoA transferase